MITRYVLAFVVALGLSVGLGQFAGATHEWLAKRK